MAKNPSKPLKDFMNVRTELADKEYWFKFYDYSNKKKYDIEWLTEQGFLVNTKKKKRDVVLCTHTINDIQDKKDRLIYIKNAWGIVRENGVLLLSARTKKEIKQLAEKNNWKKYKDGYIKNNGKFQKGFTIKELIDFAIKNLSNIKSIIPREDKKNSYSAIYITKRKKK